MSHGRRVQALAHRTGQLGRLLDHDIGAVGRQFGGEVIDVVVVDVHERPGVVHLADRPRSAPEGVATTGTDAQDGWTRRRLRFGPIEQGHRVVVGRDLVGTGPPDPLDSPGDSRESEDARGIPVEVVPGEIPVPVPQQDPPGLDSTSRRVVGIRPAIVEGHRHPLDGGVLEVVEGGLHGAQTRLDADERLPVPLDVGGSEFAERLCCRSRQRCLRPRPARQTEHCPLVGAELDVRQRIVPLVDPIALLVVPARRQVLHDQGHTEFAQVVLVALEHPVEGLVVRCRRILGHDPADLGLGHRSPRVKQHQHEIEQALGLGCRTAGHTHVRRRYRRGAHASVGPSLGSQA